VGSFLIGSSLSFVPMPAYLTLCGIYLGLDPFHVIIRQNYDILEQTGWGIVYAVQLVRVGLDLTSFIGVCRSLLLFTILFLSRTQMLEIIFTILNERANVLGKKTNFKWNIFCLNQLIICSNIDQFFEVLEFVFMSGGLLLIVSFNFAALRYYHSVPFIAWCFLPLGNLLNIFTVQMTIPKYALVGSLAEKYVQKLKLNSGIANNSYFVKRTRAILPLQLKAGVPEYPFICFTRSTTVDFYSAVINHTINIILGVP